MTLTVKGQITQEDEGLYLAECKDLGATVEYERPEATE